MGRSRDLEDRPDVLKALGRVESDTPELHLGAIVELKKIINENRQSSGLKRVDDKGFHAILETVFRVVKLDSSAYAKKSKNVRSTIAIKARNRLTACAGLVRTIVEVGLPKLRYRTVRAIAEHISQSLATSDAGYCQPLVFDYFKALAGLLEYKAHVEHLTTDDWRDLTDFCLDSARDINRTTDENDSYSHNGAASRNGDNSFRSRASRSGTPSLGREQGRSFGDHVSQRPTYPILQQSNEDIVLCLQHLVSVPTAPVLDRAPVILTTLFDLLQSYPYLSKIQQAVFETISSVMSRIVVSDTALSLQTMSLLLPFIRTCWERASQNLREILLSILLQSEILLPTLLSSDSAADSKADLSALLEISREQYCNRKHREQLHLEDMELCDQAISNKRKTPFSLTCGAVRSGAYRAEEPWTLIHISAAICVILEKHATSGGNVEEAEELRNLPKRQKIARPLAELFQFAKGLHRHEKLYALQVLAFVFEMHEFDIGSLQTHLEMLLPGLSDDDGLVASWTMFSMTCAAGQPTAGGEILAVFWLRVWRLVARNITFSMTCKAACQLMAVILEDGLVQYASITDIVDGVISSPELNGPSECDGAATRLWAILLHLRRLENLSSDFETPVKVLRWLFKRWSPASIRDRVHTAYISQQFSIQSTLRLICLCLGLPIPAPATSSTSSLGRLSQTWLKVAKDQRLINYLLLNAEPIYNEAPAQLRSTLKIASPERQLPTSIFRYLVGTLMDCLLEASSSLSHACFSENSNGSDLNADVTRVALSLCVIGYALLSSSSLQDFQQRDNVCSGLDSLKRGLRRCFLQHERQRELNITFQESFGAFLGPIAQLSARNDLLTEGAIQMSKGFDRGFWQEARPKSTSINGANEEDEAMDLDLDLDSQTSQRKEKEAVSTTIHDQLIASCSADAFRACAAARVCFMSELDEKGDVQRRAEWISASPIIEYFVSLERQDFVLCKSVLHELLTSEVLVAEDDADTLLQYLDQVLTRPYELERSEVSIGLCLDTLSDLAEMWTKNDGSDLSAGGALIYQWFMNNIFGNGVSSAYIHIRAASLFQKMIKVHPDYAKGLSLPSDRTNLFDVLRDGNLEVKYSIGNEISNIFGIFVLKEHDNILEDVIESLPSDPTWMEGIALRLHVLAHLAASWSTLLRRCVYAIFETPGNVPQSTGYAEYCLKYVSKFLQLPESRDLFKLFVSQIVYTWLESHQLKSMPFKIFGYVSLGDLFRDVQDEIVGQIVMRGKEDEAALLALETETSFETLLEVSFSKATTYSIAHDIAIAPASNSQTPKAESLAKRVFGKDRYKVLMIENFADIVALLFTTMDYEDQIEKPLQKRAEYAKAFSVYQQILAFGTSDKTLPPNQQPSFKARYLLDEIHYLCHRTGYDQEVMWTPPLYLHVFRRIVNTTHPALGPLQACSVLKKIRILVSVAGETALESYPLEMALHAIKPFLTEKHCAEDATGIAQYLIQRGASYLREVPSFVLGNAVNTLISMKAFFGSTQDSTTQESHFRAMLSKAQSFHNWYIAFLGAYRSPALTEGSAASFGRIVKAASNIKKGGNATPGTDESELLLELLRDEQSEQNLLTQSSKDSILRFLSMSFELPSDFRNDILGDDEKAAFYASTVWKTCQRGILEPNYTLWCGRVLGRAYGGKGHMDREMTLESTLQPKHNDRIMPKASALPGSRIHLLRLLCDLLAAEHRDEVGIAETTLRSIVTGTTRTEYFVDCERSLPASLLKALLWKEYTLPRASPVPGTVDCSNLKLCMSRKDGLKPRQWIQQVCVSLVLTASEDPMLSKLPDILWTTETLAEEAFPYILHLVLLREADGHQMTRQIVSKACRQRFESCTGEQDDINAIRILLKAILYLRTQPLPHEITQADRVQWLELDYNQVAAIAVQCSLHKTALLLLEIGRSEQTRAEATTPRRSSVKRHEPKDTEAPTNLLLEIYQNIDEPDAYYGVQQPASLYSTMGQLEYEHAGFKSLSFRGAHYDGQIRQASAIADDESMVRTLDNLDLNGLSQSLLNKVTNTGPKSVEAALRTARKLEQWDISAPASHASSASTVFRAFQRINNANDTSDVAAALNAGFADSVHELLVVKAVKSPMHSILASLSTLTEMDEVFASRGSEQLEEVLARFMGRNEWMQSTSYDHINDIVSCRETIFSSLSKKPRLQEMLKTPQRDALALETHVLLASSQMSRDHGALQNALTTATYLNQLVEPCRKIGLDIAAAVQFESSRVLWSQGEMTASIRMLQDLRGTRTKEPQLDQVGQPELLAKLGHQISEARLEKPDEIVKTYLGPAIKELHGISDGDEAGEVFYEFASFCDQQLQNPDSLEDFQRIQKLREQKEAEVHGLDQMIKSAGSQSTEKQNYKNFRAKAKLWFDLDDREFQRLRETRQTFLRQSIENYLVCLRASDKYDNAALRFSALWLENYNSEIANAAVAKHIGDVGSRKFAALMNQWSSRLLKVVGHFQSLLFKLVLRLCMDHPYHSMYQIFASSKTKAAKDEVAMGRYNAANEIVEQLKANRRISHIWLALHNTNAHFVHLAAERLDDPSIKPGSKVSLRQSPAGQKVESDVQKQRVPPPTMTLPLRPDCDYTRVPTIARFQPEYTVASGISMPKIITAIGTDGLKYKQLFKGGNDDLRQDAIMEQVFHAVSSLLSTQRSTRQRSLKIRTYKVLPLTATAGIIEFVPNTIPLHDYLPAAHQRHYPKDLKLNQARKYILDVQGRSVDHRIKTFQQVCDKFHPVLRYFFTERYMTPDDWFEKRLAYTRSTAAISILGHVLGLGDRHGHNILLDEKTGEVVHIDLGIAFEQGRVLPVPEVVPFRLTRDLVDGMGITGTEGVFRRCCEFTLDALRNESYSIMTILDVLRYDPLYSWSLSPLRLKKMQEAQAENPDVPAAGGTAAGAGVGEGKGKVREEAGEAERALLVVGKKLSRTLSVQATVNELIQAATDERNLAVLFCGWAAYA